jgi:hypothetical protein
MRIKSNFCGIFATVFMVVTAITIASCSQDDDDYNSDMYTLAEKMETRSGVEGGGGENPTNPKLDCGYWALVHLGANEPAVDSMAKAKGWTGNGMSVFTVYAIGEALLGFSKHMQGKEARDSLEIFSSRGAFPSHLLVYIAGEEPHIGIATGFAGTNVNYSDASGVNSWAISSIFGIMY